MVALNKGWTRHRGIFPVRMSFWRGGLLAGSLRRLCMSPRSLAQNPLTGWTGGRYRFSISTGSIASASSKPKTRE